MEITNIKSAEDIINKKCSICGKWFELDEVNFYKNKNAKNNKIYYHPYCKSCEKIKNTEYQKNNRDKKSKYNYNESHRPEREINRKEASKKRRLDGKVREWRQNNPDKIKVYTSIYSDKKHNIPLAEWEACKEYFKDSQGEWSCAYCGMTERDHKIKYKQRLHKEHVDCNGEGTLQNCVPSCRGCNTSKRKSDMKEWYVCQSFYSDLRLTKIKAWTNEDYKQFNVSNNN